MGRKRIYFSPEERRLAVNARLRFLAHLKRKNFRITCDCQGTYKYSTELDNRAEMESKHNETKRHIRYTNGDTLTEKYCKSCKTIKPACEYYTTREYLQRYCKPCHNQHRKNTRN